jgi:hypothetical protein
MVEGIIGFPDMLSFAQTVGTVGTMVLTLIFSRKQIQSLSIMIKLEFSMTWMKSFTRWQSLQCRIPP